MLPLAKGMLTALIMTLGVGPGMLINFHTSVRRGFAGGVSVVAGLYVSDLIFIAINYFGLLNLIQSFRHRHAAGIVCGAILCVFGISMALKRQKTVADPADTTPLPGAGGLLKSFLSGLLVNLTNPFVFVFWMTLMGIAALDFGVRTPPFFVYFATVVGTALCLDITKSFLFSRFRLKLGLNAPLMAWIGRGIGAALVVAGIVIIFRTIFAAGHPFHS